MIVKDFFTGRMTLRKLRGMYQDFFRGTNDKFSPPYNHIVQVGDPVLRYKAKAVDPDELFTDDFRKVLIRMKNVIFKYQCEGISAPQIGVDKRVVMFRVTNEMVKAYRDHKAMKIEPVPLQVWINPEMKILDFNKEVFPEGCGSIHGFVADVPRYRRVLLKGFDENANEKTWDATGWSARIIQHEIDHINGKLYLDSMLPNTLECCAWAQINKNAGKVFITYTPVKWWTNLVHRSVK